MAAEEVADLAQLQSNLQEYEAQLEQVEGLLLDDPDNEEYKGIYESLAEVIALTKDLIRDAETAGTAVSAAASDAAMQSQQQPQPQPAAATVPLEGAITQAPEVRLPSVLPPQVAQQIKEAQQRAALLGQAPTAWAIGAPCQAMYSGDGQVKWLPACLSQMPA